MKILLRNKVAMVCLHVALAGALLLARGANAAPDIFNYDLWQFPSNPSSPFPFSRARSATYAAAATSTPSTPQPRTTAVDSHSAGHVSGQPQVMTTTPLASFQLPSWLQSIMQNVPSSSPQVTYAPPAGPPQSTSPAPPRALQDSPNPEGSGTSEFAEPDITPETYAQAMPAPASGTEGMYPSGTPAMSSPPDTPSPPANPPASPLASPPPLPSPLVSSPFVTSDNPPPAPQQSPSSPPQTYLQDLCSQTDSSADAVFKCVNAIRTNPQAWSGQYPCDSSGWISAVSNPPRPPFKRNSQLDSSAWRQASDMAKNKYMTHSGSDGSDLARRIADTGFNGYPQSENIAAGQSSAAEVTMAWMCR